VGSESISGCPAKKTKDVAVQNVLHIIVQDFWLERFPVLLFNKLEHFSVRT